MKFFETIKNYLESKNEKKLFLRQQEYFLQFLISREQTLFLEPVDNLFKDISIHPLLQVKESQKELLQLLTNHLQSQENNLSQKELNIISTFKQQILDVKLFLYEVIENNIQVFKTFENTMKEYNFSSKELALSFYLHTFKEEYNHLDNTNIKNLINETHLMIHSDAFNDFLPEEHILNTLKNNATNKNSTFKYGMEYEMWLHPLLFSENRGEETLLKINTFLASLDLDTVITKEALKHGFERHNLEHITLPFDSLSKMLLVNEFMLNLIQEIEVKQADDLLITFDDNPIINSKTKEEMFDKEPGSIHFNVSCEDIENVNKVQLILLLKEYGIIPHKHAIIPQELNSLYEDNSHLNSDKIKDIKWNESERNEYVKHTDRITNIFGMFALNLKFGDDNNSFGKYWDVNFEHLFEKDKKDRRIEFRFIGGKGYSSKEIEIVETMDIVLHCVKLASHDNLDKDTYHKLLFKYDVDRDFNELSDKEKAFLFGLLKAKDEEDLMEKFYKIKEKIELLKEEYFKQREDR